MHLRKTQEGEVLLLCNVAGIVGSLALIYTTTTLVRLHGGRVYCRLLYECQSLSTLRPDLPTHSYDR